MANRLKSPIELQDHPSVRKGFPILIMLLLLIGLAAIPIWPVSFYLLVKILFPTGIIAALSIFWSRVHVINRFLMIIAAILFNPIIPPQFDQSAWIILDLFIILLIISALVQIGKRFIKEGSNAVPSQFDYSDKEDIQNDAVFSGSNLLFVLKLIVGWIAISSLALVVTIFLIIPKCCKDATDKLNLINEDFSRPIKISGIFSGIQNISTEDGISRDAVITLGPDKVLLPIPDDLAFTVQAGQAVTIYKSRYFARYQWQPISEWQHRKEKVINQAVYILGILVCVAVISGVMISGLMGVSVAFRSVFNAFQGIRCWLPYYQHRTFEIPKEKRSVAIRQPTPAEIRAYWEDGRLINLYQRFGVPLTATCDQVGVILDRLMKTHNPEHSSDPKYTELLLRQIGMAKRLLSDPDKRRDYDDWLQNREQVENTDFIRAIFSEAFGRN